MSKINTYYIKYFYNNYSIEKCVLTSRELSKLLLLTGLEILV